MQQVDLNDLKEPLRDKIKRYVIYLVIILVLLGGYCGVEHILHQQKLDAEQAKRDARVARVRARKQKRRDALNGHFRKYRHINVKTNNMQMSFDNCQVRYDKKDKCYYVLMGKTLRKFNSNAQIKFYD